jgi:hypothetical protein
MKLKQRGNTLVGIIIGIVLGLAAALAVAVYVTKVPVPFLNKTPSRSPEQDAAESRKNQNWDPNAPLYGKNPAKALPPTPGIPASAASPGAAPTPFAKAPETVVPDKQREAGKDKAPEAPAVAGRPAPADPLGDLAAARSSGTDPPLSCRPAPAPEDARGAARQAVPHGHPGQGDERRAVCRWGLHGARAPSTARTTRTGRKASWTGVASTPRWCGSSGSARRGTKPRCPAVNLFKENRRNESTRFLAAAAVVVGATVLRCRAWPRPSTGGVGGSRAPEKKAAVEAPAGGRGGGFPWYSCRTAVPSSPARCPAEEAAADVPSAGCRCLRDDPARSAPVLHAGSHGQGRRLHSKVFQDPPEPPADGPRGPHPGLRREERDRRQVRGPYNSPPSPPRRKAKQLQDQYKSTGCRPSASTASSTPTAPAARRHGWAPMVVDHLIAEARRK